MAIFIQRIKKLFESILGNSPFLYSLTRFLLFKKVYLFCLEYPLKLKSRYGYSRPVHFKLNEIISANREKYKSQLETILELKDALYSIPLTANHQKKQTGYPYWHNSTFSGLDAAALYSFIASFKPKTYMEIGSGNSTKFARQSIKDHQLSAKIISIDPRPRADIDNITDQNYRTPLENMELDVFDTLEASDILFVDNSHRIFMNSDATITFLDVLPRLKKGVIVHFHDITLPYDYPPYWQARLYSEQYLLAAYLLAGGNKFEILLPNAFISSDKELNSILTPIWSDPKLSTVQRDGFSFWIKVN